MVILELFEVLAVRCSLKICFKVLTGGLRIKLLLGETWNMERWKKSQTAVMLQKRNYPIHEHVEWMGIRQERKQKQSWFCKSWCLQLFESDNHQGPGAENSMRTSCQSPRGGSGRATRQEVSPFLVHKLEFQRYEDIGLSLKRMDYDVFEREFPELMTYSG